MYGARRRKRRCGGPGSMGEEEAGRILAGYEAMEEKPVFTPWQVAASEALRDGEAASAIAAWHARGRFPYGVRRGEDAEHPGRRLGPLRQTEPGQVQRGAGAHPRRGGRAVPSDEGAPVPGFGDR